MNRLVFNLILTSLIVVYSLRAPCTNGNCYLEVYEACTSANPCENEILSDGYNEPDRRHSDDTEATDDTLYTYPMEWFTPMPYSTPFRWSF